MCLFIHTLERLPTLSVSSISKKAGLQIRIHPPGRKRYNKNNNNKGEGPQAAPSVPSHGGPDPGSGNRATSPELTPSNRLAWSLDPCLFVPV